MTKLKKKSGTTAKIKELKGIKPEKITDKELKQIQDIINIINRAQLEIGILETRKHGIQHNVAIEQDKLNLLQIDFEKEYGTSNINIQDGTINYPKENGEVNQED